MRTTTRKSVIENPQTRHANNLWGIQCKELILNPTIGQHSLHDILNDNGQ